VRGWPLRGKGISAFRNVKPLAQACLSPGRDHVGQYKHRAAERKALFSGTNPRISIHGPL